MGAFLDKPKTDKTNAEGSGNGLRYGISSMQGWRVEMEDAHSSLIGLPGLPDWSFFAVFDGHAGAKVSAYSGEKLLNTILHNKDWRGSDEGEASSPSLERVMRGIKTGFLSLDSEIRKIPEMASGEDKSGSTAVCLLASPKHLFFANLGDSRAILVRNKAVHFKTLDHKPVNPQEKERIQNAGGSVMIQRVNGSLAVSRAIGDFEYKSVAGKGPCEQLVSPEPDITDLGRSGDDDEFVVLACDGIWDVMTNEDVAEFVRSRMELTDNLQDICNQVVDTCLYKGSRDNMSIVIVQFEGAPKVSEEAKRKEAEVDQKIEDKVKEIVNGADQGDVDLQYVMHLISNEDIPNLPPGGGLSSKRSVIESAFYKLVPRKEEQDDNY